MRHHIFVFRGGDVAAIAAPDIITGGSEVKREERERVSMENAMAF